MSAGMLDGRGGAKDETDPVFDRPIFIVSAPRSGSTLLFEVLSKVRDIYTIGGESHQMIEQVPGAGRVIAGLTPMRCPSSMQRQSAHSSCAIISMPHCMTRRVGDHRLARAYACLRRRQRMP